MSGSRSRNPRERLVHHVRELERLEEQKQAASDALRAGFDSAKKAGFDPATLKVVLKLRKMTPEQRKEKRALEAIYLAALGMLEGDPLPDEARKRLDEDEHPKKPERPPSKDDDEEDEPAAPAPAPLPPQPQLPLKDPEEARQEGRDAAKAGKRIYDNPFPAGDPCRAAWDEGWCEQRKSHGMDPPAAFQRRKPPEKPPDEQPGAGDQPGAP